jgi:UDP-GlcNAc3NAcA epimerase
MSRNDSVLRILTVVGARPQFIKAFALSRALRLHGGFEEGLIHTGQHFNWNMSDVFFAELGIDPPRYNLNVHGGTHGGMTARMLAAIEEALIAEKPDAVLVYGDTNSTLAGALAAAKLQIPVVHIEAGLRSYNRNMPEEINRVVVDHLSSLLCCPTPLATENLAREGITEGVHHVGDLMFEAVRIATPMAKTHSTVLERLGIREKPYGVATFHRQENLESAQRLAAIVAYLREQSRSCPLIVPLHPRTRVALEAASLTLDTDEIRTIEPLGYLDMCRLTHCAEIVLTDSGGLQREAYFHRVPCVTLRDETEWKETIDCGWNRLWTSPEFGLRREVASYDTPDAGETICGLLEDTFARRDNRTR